jgi:multifunctional beta-oxidation protein
MTRTVRSEEQVQAMKPEYVAPLIAVLCSDKCPTPTGKLYESGSGWFAETRWQRTRGVDFPHDKGVPSAEAVLEVIRFSSASQFDISLTAKKKAFNEICNFDNGLADNPESPADGSKYSMGNVMKGTSVS